MSVTETELGPALRQAVDNQARTRGTKIWMRALGQDDRRANFTTSSRGWFMETPDSAAFGKKYSTQSVWFEFVHRQHPTISAVLFLTWKMQYDERVSIASVMAYQNTLPGGDNFQEYTNQWEPVPEELRSSGTARNKLRARLDSLHPTDGLGEFGAWNHLTYRQGVAKFLEILRAFAGVSQVTIPDLRGVDLDRGKADFGKLTLNLADSNFDKRLYSELLDHVQGESVIERLKEHLDGVARELRNLGLVVRPTANLATLTKASPSDLPVRLTVRPDDDIDSNGAPTRDAEHELHIDLLRGTLTVSCSRDIGEDVLQAWEVARFKAELTGEEDVLLAYAKAFNDPAKRARIERVTRAKNVAAQPL